MAVAPQYRRKGVASELLQAVDADARARNVPLVCLFVESKNTAAISLYMKLGYRLVTYSPQAIAFASAIGLYSGVFRTREYFFMYKYV